MRFLWGLGHQCPTPNCAIVEGIFPPGGGWSCPPGDSDFQRWGGRGWDEEGDGGAPSPIHSSGQEHDPCNPTTWNALTVQSLASHAHWENHLTLCLTLLGVRREILKVPVSRNWFQNTLLDVHSSIGPGQYLTQVLKSLPVNQGSCGLYSYWQAWKGVGSYGGSERLWGHLRVISINTEGSPAVAASNGWVFKSSETNSNVLDTVM